MANKFNELFKKSVNKCYSYCKNHTRFDCVGKKYIIDSNIWEEPHQNYFLYEIIKMEGNMIVEDKKLLESQNMEDISRYLWNLAGYKI